MSEDRVIARHDPPASRFKPDRELVARAQHAMMDAEDERRRFVRQRWEEAFSAVRVALSALREILPTERDAMDLQTSRSIGWALTSVDGAYKHLDAASEAMLGSVMHEVLTGVITTHEQLDARLGISR